MHTTTAEPRMHATTIQLTFSGVPALSPRGVRRVYSALSCFAQCEGPLGPEDGRLLRRYAEVLGLGEQEQLLLDTLAECPGKLRLGTRRDEREFLFDAVRALTGLRGEMGPHQKDLVRRLFRPRSGRTSEQAGRSSRRETAAA